MKRFFCAGVALLSFLRISASINPQFSLVATPEWVLPIPEWNDSHIKLADVSNGYEVTSRNIQVNVDLQIRYYRICRKIYTTNGIQNASEIEASFDPTFQKLHFHELTVVRNGVRLNRLILNKFKLLQQENERENYIYNGRFSAIQVLEDIRVGDVIEYAYSTVGFNPLFKGYFFDDYYLETSSPSAQLFIRILLNSQQKLFFKYNKKKIEPTIKSIGYQSEYTWHLEKPAFVKIDNELPSWYIALSYVTMSTAPTWKNVVNWAAPFYELKNSNTADIIALANKLKKDKHSGAERIGSVLAFIQAQIRYTGINSGIGGYKPNPPEQVLSRRFGDCKDKSILMCSLLKALDIEAYPVLVHTDFKEKVLDEMPTPYAFNHCIVMAKIHSDTIWYDPTLESQYGKYNAKAIPPYGYGLIIKSGINTLSKIPEYSQGSVSSFERFECTSFGAPVKFFVETTYSGKFADRTRNNFRQQSIKERNLNYLNYYAKTYPGIELVDSNSITMVEDSIENTCIIKEKYSINNFWVIEDSSKANILKSDFYPSMFYDYISKLDNPIRSMPIGIYHPLKLSAVVEVKLPRSINVKSSSTSVDGPCFKFKAETSYNLIEKEVKIRYEYETTTQVLPATQAKSLVESQRKMFQEMGTTITINTNDLEPISDVNNSMVVLAILSLVGVVLLALRVYRFDPKPKSNFNTYSQVGSWLLIFYIPLLLIPVRTLYVLFLDKDISYFSLTIWENLTNPSGETYKPLLAYFMALELIYNIGVFVMYLLLLKLFYERRTSVPIIVTVLASITLVFQILTTIVFHISDVEVAGTYKSLFQSFGFALIWIPSFLLSERSKSTFIERYSTS